MFLERKIAVLKTYAIHTKTYVQAVHSPHPIQLALHELPAFKVNFILKH